MTDSSEPRQGCVVVGADISIRHLAVVALDLTFAELATFYLCKKRKNCLEGEFAWQYPDRNAKREEKALYEMDRLVWLQSLYEMICDYIADIAEERPVYVVQEDYAYAAERGAHQIGEVGGLFKAAVKAEGFALRLHSPGALKMFTTDNGTASKEMMAVSAGERWGDQYDFGRFPNDAHLKAVSSRDDVRGDVVDAYGLARMGVCELLVREGIIELKDLEKGERRTFLRVTKRYPVNLLERPWA